MEAKGWSHVGLVTRNIERTRAFYEGVLGFPLVRGDVIRVKEGGEVHHVFFDVGRGQLLAFMEFRGVPGTQARLDTNLNQRLSIPRAFHAYHFALEAGSEADLLARRTDLIAKGVRVSPIVNHEWAKSIYLRDPNEAIIEFSFQTRPFDADDARVRPRFEFGLGDPVPWSEFLAE